MRYALLLFLLFVVQGCISFSSHPLSKPGIKDTSLFGRWSVEKNGKTSYLSITPSKQKKELIITYEESDDPDGDETIRFKGHISILNKRKYLNLKIIQTKDAFPDGYIFCQYHTDASRLRLNPINPEVIQEAIRNKALQGKIETDTFLPIATITADQKYLQKYIIKHADILFTKEILFYKEVHK